MLLTCILLVLDVFMLFHSWKKTEEKQHRERACKGSERVLFSGYLFSILVVRPSGRACIILFRAIFSSFHSDGKRGIL